MHSEKLLDRIRAHSLRTAPNFSEHLTALKVAIREGKRNIRKASSSIFRKEISEAVRSCSCLQIGTSLHFAFERISADSKTLITRSADFDPRTFEGQKENLFAMNFAEYLEHFQTADDKYDVVQVGDEFDDLSIKSEWDKIATPNGRYMNEEIETL